MKQLKAVVEEIIGLFVDDWRFAGLVVIWILLFVVLQKYLPGPFRSTVLVLPIAGIVLAFVFNKAKQA